MVEGCYRKIEKRTIAELTKMAIIWNVFELFLPVLRKETLHQPELFVAAKACREGEFFPIRRPVDMKILNFFIRNSSLKFYFYSNSG
jgi:hypothetical protein